MWVGALPGNEMRIRLCILTLAISLPTVSVSAGQTEVYLSLEDAPKAVLPEADEIIRVDVPSDEPMREKMKPLIGRLQPSIWEPYYITFEGRKAGKTVGYAVICEEIGKHRPMTFIVSADTAGRVLDVALMMYREPIGAEVRYDGFVRQFDGKSLDDPIYPRRDVKNISGATLSVRAMSRGVRKALAVLQVHYLQSGATVPAAGEGN